MHCLTLNIMRLLVLLPMFLLIAVSDAAADVIFVKHDADG